MMPELAAELAACDYCATEKIDCPGQCDHCEAGDHCAHTDATCAAECRFDDHGPLCCHCGRTLGWVATVTR